MEDLTGSELLAALEAQEQVEVEGSNSWEKELSPISLASESGEGSSKREMNGER